MINRLTTRPLVQRGLGIATAGLLVAGSLLVPAAVHASGQPPVAVDDTISGTEDTDLVIDTSVLLANDTDPEDDVLTVTALEDEVLDGTVELVGTTITFHPVLDDCGDDTAFFRYDVSDGTNGPDIGMVHVNLACVNDKPHANNDVEQGHEDDPLVMTDHDLVANDDDVDTDNNDLFIAGANNATHGSVSYNSTTHNVTFTPTPGQCNPIEGSFDYTVSDGDKTDTGHVTVPLTCNGTNHDPVATNDVRSGTEDTALHITGASLVANDTDADGDTLTVVSTKNPLHGTVSLAAGTVTFTPAANVCGDNSASFEYDVSDGTDGDDFGLVTISLTCVNDPAVANPDSGSIDENSGPHDFNVLANDTDAEGDPITLQSATVSATAGTASVVAGKVRYTPTAVFSGVATITYTISDTHVNSQGTLSVLVGEDNVDPIVTTPRVAFGSGRVDDTAPLKISWSGTDLGSGIKTFKAQVRIGSGDWKTISKGKDTSVTKDYPFKKDLTFRVRATDKVGNVSGWVQSATRRITQFKHTNGDVDYTGDWTRVVGSHPYAFTTGNEKSARLTFTGRGVLYVAPKTDKGGFVKVYIDGNLIGRFSLHSGSTKLGVIIARASWATTGEHKIRIVNDVKGDRTNLAAFVTLK